MGSAAEESVRVGAGGPRGPLAPHPPPPPAAHLGELADAVLARFAAGGGPEGAPDAATLRNLRVGARAAAVCFVAWLGGERAPADLDLFVAHGRAQQAAGRTLTELLSFYRLGGLAMWERSTALLPDTANAT